MFASVDICCHYVVVGPVEEYFPEELDRLALRHVAVGLYQNVVVLFEEELEVRVEIFRNKLLVLSKELLGASLEGDNLSKSHVKKTHSECRESIGSHLEGALVDPVEKFPEDAIPTLLTVDIDTLDTLSARS